MSADAPGQSASNVRVIPEIPTVFADGVMSQSYISGVSKFYLYRTDSAPDAASSPKNTVIAQVIMSAEGFAAMVHFFEHRLKIMIDANAISQESVDRINMTVYPDPRKGTL